MILGIGTDLCDLDRIAGAIERQGQRFLDRVFTKAEQEEARGSETPSSLFASGFAAKEACVKALGTGITDRVRWTDLGIIGIASRSPTLELAGGALRRANRLKPKTLELAVHLSLSLSRSTALAVVIIEGRTRSNDRA